MPKWRRTIKFRDAIGEDTSPEGIDAAATRVMDRLAKTTAPVSRIEKARDMAADDPETALLVFNDGLNRIYDWADDQRVWLA